jgi:hypothetical protein
MAYQYTDYSGYGNETEEETRRRRAMMLAGLPEGAGFGDIASQALTNRMGQAQNTMTQAGQMVTNPEEELRKRMGQQTAGPVAPQQMAQPAVQMQVPEQLPSQGPISPEMAQQAQPQPQMPQPGPAVQVAGPANLAQMAQTPQIAQAQRIAQAQQPVVSPDQKYYDQIISAGNETDPSKRRNMFAQVLAKEDVSEGNKVLANRLIAEDYMKQKAISDAEQKIAQATPNDLSRYMKERTKEGSYVKALLYARLGLNDLAQKEQELLSPTLKMGGAIDDQGNRYTVERDNKGAIVRGFDASGRTINQETLSRLSASGVTDKGIDVDAGTYMDPTGKVGGNWVLERRPGGTMFRQVGTGAIASPEQAGALRKVGVGGTLSDQRSRMVQEINLKLQGKTAEEKMAILRPYNQQLVGAGYPAISPEEVGISAPQIQAPVQQAQPMAQAQPAPAQQAPAQQMPAQQAQPQAGPAPAVTASQLPGGGVKLGAGRRPTATEIELNKEAGKQRIETQAQGERTILTEAAKQVAASPDTQNMLNSINKVTTLLDSGQHNIGSTLSGAVGRGPIAQAIGSQFETTDARNTKTIMDTVNKLAADGLKVLGSNPSTVDLEFWTKFKPDASSDPEQVKDWIQSRSDDLKRRLGYAGTQQGLGGRGGVAPEVPKSQPKLSREDTQALEWARKNPNDPRAKEIKQRLGL